MQASANTTVEGFCGRRWEPLYQQITCLYQREVAATRTYCIAQGALLIVMWQPGWEGVWGENACVYAQLCPTLCDPTDYSLPGSPIHEVLQARILEWVAISSSRRYSRPRDQTCIFCVSCIGKRILYCWLTWEAPWGRMDTCVGKAESFLCPPETVTTLSINKSHLNTKEKVKKKAKRRCRNMKVEKASLCGSTQYSCENPSTMCHCLSLILQLQPIKSVERKGDARPRFYNITKPLPTPTFWRPGRMSRVPELLLVLRWSMIDTKVLATLTSGSLEWDLTWFRKIQKYDISYTRSVELNSYQLKAWVDWRMTAWIAGRKRNRGVEKER